MNKEITQKRKQELVLCDEVASFALRMQSKLDVNQHKECSLMNPDGEGRSWKRCDIFWLLLRLREETIELEKALRSGISDVHEEAADVGNFAMFIYDIC